MDTLQKSLDIAIERIDENTKLFYQNKTQIGYKELDETLRLIGIFIDEYLKYQEDLGVDKTDETKLIEILSNAMNALEQQDGLLLSDILQYELMEMLIEIRETLK